MHWNTVLYVDYSHIELHNLRVACMCVRMYACMYIGAYAHGCSCVCVCEYISLSLSLYIYIYIHTYIHTWPCLDTNPCIAVRRSAILGVTNAVVVCVNVLFYFCLELVSWEPSSIG